jgi:hypothetical protein
MHACGALPFLDRWSDRCSHDDTLKKIINAARQEFPELSDEQVRNLWIGLQSLLIGWAKRRGEALPMYRIHHGIPSIDRKKFSIAETSTSEIDFVVLFFLAGGYQPLASFLQDLAPQPLMSLRKAFALMILREAEEENWPEIKRLMRSYERVVQ